RRRPPRASRDPESGDRSRPRGGRHRIRAHVRSAARKLLAPARAPRLILAPEDKLELLRLSGIDGVIVLNFTLELSLLSPRDFVRDYLRARIGVREVVEGQNFRFGHNRAGTPAVMVELGRELGF